MIKQKQVQFCDEFLHLLVVRKTCGVHEFLAHYLDHKILNRKNQNIYYFPAISPYT